MLRELLLVPTRIRLAIARIPVLRLAVVVVLIGLSAHSARGLACSNIDDQCTVTNTGTCQADGSCQGTPMPDDTPCDGEPSSCASIFQCKSGRCKAVNPAGNGTTCTFSFPLNCIDRAECQDGQCIPVQIHQCPASGNLCAPNVCNFLTGACAPVTLTCQGPCLTGQCNPATGQCTFAPDTTGCDDGDECTSGDHCHAGECVAGGAPVASATPTATGHATTPTATTAVQPSVTSTSFLPTPTRTATPSPLGTATSTVAQTPIVCVGDCDDNAHISVDELVTGVNIALGNLALNDCSQFDADSNQHVTVDELVQAVNGALNGCVLAVSPTRTTTGAVTPTATGVLATPTVTGTGAIASPTPSQTSPQASTTATRTGTTTGVSPTPTHTVAVTPSIQPTATVTPTPSATLAPPSVARRMGGAIGATTDAALIVPNLLSAVLGHTNILPGSAAATLFDILFNCPAGGSGHVSCDQNPMVGIPPFGPPTYTLTLSNCAVTTGTVGQTFNGIIVFADSQVEICGQLPGDGIITIPSLTVSTQGVGGSVVATFSNVSGAVLLSGADDACRFSDVDLQLAGSIAVVSKDGNGTILTQTQLTFGDSSSIDISVAQYADQCVPVIYTMTLNGAFAFTTDGNNFAATLTSYTIMVDATSGTNLIDIEGDIASDCLGATSVTLSTNPANLLIVASNRACPSAGMVELESDTFDAVSYTAAGGVEVDFDDDGTVDETFTSCLDPQLQQCPAS